MLSRVADSLYWMSRYLERAEHCSRLIDVHLNFMLDQTPASAEHHWNRVAASLGVVPPKEAAGDAYVVARLLALDHANPSSIVSCIMCARDNARQVRELISSEMWEELNRLFHEVRRAGIDDLWDSQLSEFLRAVREGCHLFHGLTDSTMSHGQGWYFIQVGRYMERALSLTTLLDHHYQDYESGSEVFAESGEHLEWIALLRSCTAFEAYCKVYTADLTPPRIAEFLLLNESFPHSVRFAVDQLERGLGRIQEAGGLRRAVQVDRLAGRLKATLNFGQIDEVMASGLHSYLETIQRQCQQIHAAIYQLYISYPVEAALEA